MAIVPAGAQAASTGPAPVSLTARVATPVAPRGGIANIAVGVANRSTTSTAAGARTSFTVAIPAGLAWDGVTVLSGANISCHVSGAHATCATSRALRAHSSLEWLVRLRVGDAASATRVVRITGGGTAAGQGRRAAIRIGGTPSPVAVVELGGALAAEPGRSIVATVDVLNVGTGRARAVGGLPSIELSNLLPAPVVGAWRAAGRGWICTGAAGTSPRCALAATVPAGARAPRLTLRYRFDPAKVEPLHLVPGGKPSVQKWQVATVAHGDSGAVSGATPAFLDVLPPPAAILATTTRAAHNLLELLPGGKATVLVDLTNIGRAATSGPTTFSGRIPSQLTVTGVSSTRATWSCLPVTETFTCRTSARIAPRGALRVSVHVEARSDATPGTGVFAVAAVAANTDPTAKTASSALPFEVLEGDAGFPSVVVLRAAGNGRVAPVLDGSPARLLSGQELTERLDVRNAGGAEIATASRIALTQTFTRGSTIRAIRAPAGWQCSGTTALSCTYVAADPVRPAGIVEGPTVTVTAGSAVKGEQAWPARIGLVPAGRTKALRAPVLVEITRGVASLAANLKTLTMPTAGGTGAYALFVRNTGNAATDGPVTSALHLPRGVRVATAVGAGWSCTVAPSRTSVRCVSRGPLPAGGRLKRVSLTASFSRATGNRALTLGVHAAAAGARAATGSLDVLPRHGIVAKIGHHVAEVTDVEPLVRANETPVRTVLALEADGSGGSGAALHYRWRQTCPTGACPAATWTTSRNEADTEFTVPRVTKPTRLFFQVTVGDGSAHASTTTSVRVVPFARASSGATFRAPHPRAERPETVSVRKTPLPPAAVPLKKKPATAPHPDTAPPTTTTTETTTTTPETTTAQTTTAAAPALPGVFCALVRDAVASSFTATLAGVSLELENVSRPGAACDPASVVHFSGSTLAIHGYLHATGVSGTITPAGIEFAGGTFTGPEAWHLPELQVTRRLTIAFSADGATLGGSVSADGDVPFLPLSSRWHGTTTLSFGSGDNGASVSLATEAEGPRSESSPASPLPALTIGGAIRGDGTFALALDVARLVQVRGNAVDVTGHVTRPTPDGPIEYSASGDAPAPFTVLGALGVDALHVTFEPTEGSLGIKGHGVLGITGFGDRLKLPFVFRYADPEDYSLVAESGGSSAYEPLPGLTAAPDAFKGSIVAKNDHLSLDVSASVAHWAPASGVAVSSLKLAILGGCPNTAVSCRENAVAYIDLKGDVAFTLPKDGGTLHSHLEGTIVPDLKKDAQPAAKGTGAKALNKGKGLVPGIEAFRLVAAFPQGFGLGGGVTIDRPSLVIQAGMPLPPEEPTPVNTNGSFLVDIAGGVTIPGIGSSPIVHATFSHDGWAIAAPIGTFSMPGASGDGTQLTDAVVGWSTFPTQMEVLDRSTQKAELVDLPGKVFKLTGEYTAPGWAKRVLGQTTDVKGRATGLINPAAGTYGLRMSLGIDSAPFIYGDATSATNVRITGGFFELARTDSLFSLTLGGLAKMAVAGGDGLDPSTIDLEAALTLDSAGTVVGRLSFAKPEGWKNAFGVSDLTLHKLAFQFGLKLKAPVPDLGLTADAVLPASARSALGQASFARTLVVAQISVRNPCLGVQVSDPTAARRNVMSLGNGAVTAKSFELWFAPRGCTVNKVTFKPGASLKFDGAVGGISVALEATVGFKPFTFDGFVDLAETPLGGVTVKRTRITAKLAPNLLHVTFSGGIDIFGTNVDVSGKIEQRGSDTVVDLTGTLDQLAIGGDLVTAKNLRVTLFTATGEKQVASVRVSGKIKVLTAEVDGTAALSQVDGKLEGIKADLTAKVAIGGSNGLVLAGLFKLDYEKDSKKSLPRLDADVTASALGAQLNKTKVVVQNGFVQLSSVYTYGGAFTAFIEGGAYFGRIPAGATSQLPDGTKVPARTGDFFLAARDVSLKLGPFNAAGKVWLGHVGGTVRAELSASMQLTGGAARNTAYVEGLLDANTGNFNLVGSSTLDLVGFTQKVKVAVVQQPGRFNATGTLAVGVLGSTVDVTGDFRYHAGSFLFTLAARANLTVGGYSISQALVTLSNEPGSAGLLAELTVSAGGAATVSGTVAIEPNGRFFLSAKSSVRLGVLSAAANVTFANVEPHCFNTITSGPGGFFDFRWARRCSGAFDTAPYVEAEGEMSFPVFNRIGFMVYVRIGPGGAYKATFRSPVAGWTSFISPNLGTWPVDGRATLRFYVQLDLNSAASPVFDVHAAGEGDVQYQYWTFWSGWSSWNNLFGVKASVNGINPLHGCAYATVLGQDVGGCI